MLQSRRSLLASAAGAAATLVQARGASLADSTWQRTWKAALDVLRKNVRPLASYPHPLLWEGSTYQGVWQECGPQEALVYVSMAAQIGEAEAAGAKQVARNNHLAFFALQRSDGQLPANVKATGTGFGQIQMVVPIAATAWELAHATGDEELLTLGYGACSRWDTWLRTYRDTRKTGLVEGFCTYDTGMDNSPRWAGIPNRCLDGDARRCPAMASLPRLCPDLSATVYGGRVALAGMAAALGKNSEAAQWKEDAEKIRRLIVEKLYSAEDAAFYDVDAQGKFVRVRSDVITRVLGEHVLNPADRRDRAIFDEIWLRELHNPEAFWAEYPFPSSALNDPTFVRPIPRNSWGGASQALTALRAPRWMLYYGKQAEMKQLMQRWCEAIAREGEFRQQMDPQTGEFTRPDPGGYSPAALVFLDFARRLGLVKSA
ncbi:MAG: alpha-L-rhamnosidase [Acidobacteriaceae bacterium]|nr:alpha-L-rhamnosidase [Acidobacteriaceae bacterium]